MRIDAPTRIDAPVDSGPSMSTLSETNNSTMVYGGSIACFDSVISGSTAAENWYRIFQLSDFAISTALHITQINFSIQESAGTPTVTIKVGTYTGAVGGSTVDTSKITAVAQTTAQIPATTGMTGETVIAPLAADIPAGSSFVVEILSPDLTANSNRYVFIGATTAGEMHPGYYQATACNHASPVTTAAAGGTGQIIIDVLGMH
jgi:hypothetical protein